MSDLLSSKKARKAPAVALLESILLELRDKPIEQRSEPFTLAEVANRWHCSEKQVEILCLNGRLKSFKPGRHRLVRPAALAEYERKQSGETL